MKHHKLFIMFAVILIWGCANHQMATVPPTSPPTLPTNARDAADANAFRVIADAYAFLSSVNTSVTSGHLTLTATQKTLFNDTIASYNAAYAIGLAYHNGSSSQTTLTAATTSLQTKLQQASAQIAVSK